MQKAAPDLLKFHLIASPSSSVSFSLSHILFHNLNPKYDLHPLLLFKCTQLVPGFTLSTQQH